MKRNWESDFDLEANLLYQLLWSGKRHPEIVTLARDNLQEEHFLNLPMAKARGRFKDTSQKTT